MSPERHLRWSVGLVAVSLAMGLVLEAMLGLRDEAWTHDPLRRELLRLGHAHGAGLGLLNLGLAWTLERLAVAARWATRIRVAALLGASLVGLGFIGGGLWHGPTDPGPLVLAVPAGALLVLSSLIAVALSRPRDGARPRDQSHPEEPSADQTRPGSQ